MADRETFIRERRALFWSVSDARLGEISDPLLVETILNYGTLPDVRALFQLLGVAEVARIFRQTTQNRVRTNYFPEVANYFSLYFNRHVPEHSL